MDDTSLAIYVTNLSQFEATGEMISRWFTLPVSMEEIREKLQMEKGAAFEVEDWEAPFALYAVDDQNLSVLNHLALLTEENCSYAAFPYLEELFLMGAFESLAEGLEHLKEYKHLNERPTESEELARIYAMADGTFIIV